MDQTAYKPITIMAAYLCGRQLCEVTKQHELKTRNMLLDWTEKARDRYLATATSHCDILGKFTYIPKLKEPETLEELKAAIFGPKED